MRAQEALDVIDEVLNTPEPELVPLVCWARPSNGDSELLVGKRGKQAECIGCYFVADGQGTYISLITNEFLRHLQRHRRLGHLMPVDLITTIAQNWSPT